MRRIESISTLRCVAEKENSKGKKLMKIKICGLTKSVIGAASTQELGKQKYQVVEMNVERINIE